MTIRIKFPLALVGLVGVAVLLASCRSPSGTPVGVVTLGATNPPVTGPGGPPGPASSCVGPYRLYAKFKNGSSSWFTAPSGCNSCRITDLTPLAKPPYFVKVEAVEASTLRSWCDTNSVAFPVVPGRKYQFSTYVINTAPPPSTGDILTLSYTWY
jgi:hypothetical protein